MLPSGFLGGHSQQCTEHEHPHLKPVEPAEMQFCCWLALLCRKMGEAHIELCPLDMLCYKQGRYCRGADGNPNCFSVGASFLKSLPGRVCREKMWSWLLPVSTDAFHRHPWAQGVCSLSEGKNMAAGRFTIPQLSQGTRCEKDDSYDACFVVASFCAGTVSLSTTKFLQILYLTGRRGHFRQTQDFTQYGKGSFLYSVQFFSFSWRSIWRCIFLGRLISFCASLLLAYLQKAVWSGQKY